MKTSPRIINGAAAIAVVALSSIVLIAPQVVANGPEVSRSMTAAPGNPPKVAPFLTSKATIIIGTTVKNPQGEVLGKVENLMLDLETGRIVAVIVASGGFIGLGEVLSAIPPNVLKQEAGQDFLVLNLSPEELAALPHFPAGEWPDLSQPEYVDGIYRAYRVPPYFVKTQTEAQAARERRLALEAEGVDTMTRDGKYIISFRPANEEEEQQVADLLKEIEEAKAANRRLEIKLRAEENQ